jgi:poly-gamma-glutamate synthesis protein (capsule biosynthesis protein)
MNMKKWRKRILLCISMVILSGSLTPVMLLSSEKTISIAAVGDCSFCRRVNSYTENEFLDLIKLIRGADAAYGNMEGTIHDKTAYPAPKDSGVFLKFEPFIADQLEWAGFDIMGLANNHSMDYMSEGLFETQKNLEHAGIIPAGAGKDLKKASAPVYFDSKNGRIALINCASTFPSCAMATEAQGEMIGRPGINPIRLKTTYQVTEGDLEALEEIDSSLRPAQARRAHQREDIYNFLGLVEFKSGAKREVITEADERDVKRITDSIRHARENAQVVIVGVHAHEQGPFLQKFARACIDAGADCIFGSGPHLLKGLEIYKDKPIFYSLGNFLLQNDLYDLTRIFRDEIFWSSLVASVAFDDGKLKSIKLYPITLNFKTDRADPLGRPMLMDEETGKRIIDHMIDLSDPLGTTIIYKKGIGVVQLK